MYKIGILASTKGTDLQAIIDEMKDGKMPGIEIAIVLSNKKNAYALERARLQEIKAFFVDPEGKTREQYDEELARILIEHKVDLVCLIGYMRILSPSFVHKFPRRIINVHPALMPKHSGPGYFGANVHEEVIKHGEKESGCTIHFVEEGVDSGEIIAQEKVTLAPDETPQSLKEKVQALEKKLYPEVIRRFDKGEI
ncbi:phosphoribosylglycinamide formyltransferase [Patescibacteria group bacterium]|nr:phosphoribosylglycinamide formyltransferase [Patescibacteria group bacterium]